MSTVGVMEITPTVEMSTVGVMEIKPTVEMFKFNLIRVKFTLIVQLWHTPTGEKCGMVNFPICHS